MNITRAALIIGSCLVAGLGRADSGPTPPPLAADSSVVVPKAADRGLRPWYEHPDLLGFSAGYYNALRSDDRKDRAADFRIEYRSSLSLLPRSSWDGVFQIRPMAGLEGTSDSALYAFGGFVFDILLGRHFFLSPNEVVGLYGRGNGKTLGSLVEFRSTLEAGYRFDNAVRVSVSLGHISNANLSTYNPGTEIVSGQIYFPLDWRAAH